MREETDAAIAIKLPAEWARANDPKLRNRSKARNNLRKRYSEILKYEQFVTANPDAKCIECEHCKPFPSDAERLHCELDSDFYGYQQVAPDYVCTRFAHLPKDKTDDR